MADFIYLASQSPRRRQLLEQLGVRHELLLPGADEALADRLTERLANMPPTTTLLRQGLSPEQIVARLLEDFPYQTLGTTPLSFVCNCSQQQTLDLLRTLGVDELDPLIEAAHGAEVTCDYCKQVHTVDHAKLLQIRASL